MVEGQDVPSGVGPGEEGDCAWGVALNAEWAAREPVSLPEGWRREFIAHWDCAPGVLYFAPKNFGGWETEEQKARKLREPDFTICPSCEGIEVGGYGNLKPDDLLVIAIHMKNDYDWLAACLEKHGEECTHGAEADARAVVSA